MPDENVNIIFNAIDNASGPLGGILGKLKDLGTTTGMVAAAMGIATGAVVLFRKSLDAAAESETGMARLSGTLHSMGRDAEISAGQIDKMAYSLMQVSTFDDEDIVNAYNALARFSSIPTDSMDSLVKVSMDMASVLGGDLTSNAESIAKLLESGLIPRTWGWSAALKEQVKALIDGGDTAGAMNLVMEKLNSQFGGQAAAQLDTYAGSLASMENELETLLENMGDPALLGGKGWNNWWKELFASFNLMFSVSKDAGSGLSEFAESEDEAARASNKLAQAIPLTTEELQKLADAEEALRKSIISQDTWEEMWTGAKTTAERSKDSFDLMGSMLQELGDEGALVWEQFLVNTGKISPAAQEQFIRILEIYQHVKDMVAGGIPINIIAGYMGAALTAATTPGGVSDYQYKGTRSGPGTGGAWLSPTLGWHFGPSGGNDLGWARGGSVSGRYAITGDSISGRPTGYEELVDFQAKRVYSAPQTRAMGALNAPHNAGGSGDMFGNLEAILKALPRDMAAAVARIIPA
jgi:hypothetical protein